MLSSFFTVFQKGFILFIMMAVGYVCGKTGMLTKRGAQQITSILLYIVTPCLTIASLQSIIGKIAMQNLLVCTAFSVLAMVAAILISRTVFRKSIAERKKVLQFACAYSNSSFMGIPLVEAVLGSTGVAYASMYNTVFNLFIWSHGLSSMSSKKTIHLKQILLNPGVIGIAIGLPLFAFSYRIPEVLDYPIRSLSSLNTPLAMIVIGSYISRVNLKELFNDADLYLQSFMRLLVIPLATFALLLPFHGDKIVVSSVLLLCCAPTAAMTAMFASQFAGDAKLASKSVALSTLFSMLTMPVMSILAQRFF
jgi:predicted permease